jgi:hypothetical protein
MAQSTAMNPSARRSPAPVAVLGLAAALLVAACGTTAPTPAVSGAPSVSPSGSSSGDAIAALYAEIEAQVAVLRELATRAEVDRTVLDEDGLRAHVQELLDEQLDTTEAKAGERLLKALGLIPADADLKALYEETLSSQIAGQYDPDDKRMYIISKSGAIGPNEQITYAHEFTHALQDQYFDLNAYQGEELDQGDRQTARAALVEGDATLLMSYWARDNLTPAELAEVIGSTDPEVAAILERMPKIISESLLFPYQAGLSFVLSAQMQGGWAAVDAMFGNPPASTEQILHPEKYASGEAPVAVTFPADAAAALGTGWAVAAQDTIGEFALGVWLRDVGDVKSGVAADATAGWGGDRVALFEGPSGAWGAVAQTAWDSEADADEFALAAEGLLAALRAGGQAAEILRPAPDRVVLFVTDGPDTLGRIANVLGFAG